MNLGPRIEKLLQQYTESEHSVPLDLMVNSSAQPKVIDGVSCVPDGGMSAFLARHERQMRIEQAARAVRDALPFMPAELRLVFDATYVGERREVPRTDRDAAGRLGVSVTKFQKLHYGLLCWFGGFNFRAWQWEGFEAEAGAFASTRSKGRKRA